MCASEEQIYNYICVWHMCASLAHLYNKHVYNCICVRVLVCARVRESHVFQSTTYTAIFVCVREWERVILILQAPPNLHPFVLEGLVRTKTFFILLLGVAYSVSKSESWLSSEVRNYDHHRWETNKQMRDTNTPCVPFDVFLFYHLGKMRKSWSRASSWFERMCHQSIFSPSIFCRSLSGTAGPLRRRK